MLELEIGDKVYISDSENVPSHFRSRTGIVVGKDISGFLIGQFSNTSYELKIPKRGVSYATKIIDVTEKYDTSPLATQTGGSHYKDLAIQPIEYNTKNNLSFSQGNVIKYVTRYKNKNGAEDLKKAIHMLEMMLDLEYGE